MAGCTYKNCSAKRDVCTHMFRYPISNKLRCQQWLMNAQKIDHFNEQQLKNRLICQHHFRDDDFVNSCLKKRLKLDAVPTLDGPFCGYNNWVNIAKDFEQGFNQNEVSISDNDEIEIEEHDLLQNPDIKRIFPDLSIIKKEILLYEEGLAPSAEKLKQEIIDEIPEHNSYVLQPESKQIVQQHIIECIPNVQLHTPDHALIAQQHIPECKPIIQQHIPECTQVIQQHIPECKPIVQQYIPEYTLIMQQQIPECNVQQLEAESKSIVQQHTAQCKKYVQQYVPQFKQSVQQHITESNSINPQHVLQDKPIVEQHIPDKCKQAIQQPLHKEPLCKEVVQQNILEYQAIIEQHIDSIPTSPSETKVYKTAQQTPVLLNLLTNTTTKAPSDNNLATHLRFKTFLDSLVDDSVDIDDDSCGSHSSTEPQFSNDDTPSCSSDLTETTTSSKDLKFVRNNIFILGSKPNNNEPKSTFNKIRPIKVVLKDIRSYLNRSSQYCKTCLILFPNTGALKWHMNEIHTPKNKIFSSVNKLQKKSNKLILANKQYECDICDIKFCSKDSLKRHKKRLAHCKRTENIQNSFQGKEGGTSLQQQTKKSNVSLQANNITDISGSPYCSHCTKHFQSHNSLIEHLYEVINPNLNASSKPESNKNSDKLDTVDNDVNNAKKLVSQKIPCAICTLTFSNQRDLRTHFKEIHIEYEIKTNNMHSSNKKNRVEQATHISQENDQSKNGQANQENNGISNQENINNIIKSGKRNRRETDIEIDKIFDNEIEQEFSDPEHANAFSDIETGHENSYAKKYDEIIEEKLLYQCFICSKYHKYFKPFCIHMLGHNINIKVDLDKTVFKPYCKFCNLKLAGIKYYNNHILSQHSERINKKMELDNKGFHSVIFECMKCNIFFMSAETAKNHSEHNEIFINWSCSDCHRTFKINDKPLHLKQHIKSKNITAFVLSDSALNRVLCKCLKCAVHFSEDEYVIHYKTCELKSPNSVYCKTCDILINKNDMNAHEHNHKHKKLGASDFTIVESALFINHIKKNRDEKIRLKFGLNYCYTCSCFISDMSSTRKAHVEGRCGVICQRTCKKCGLIFTNRGYLSHKAMHDDVKNLSMQAFKFYDINTKMQINPPMPKYPNCKICKVHFLNKQIIKQHQCNQQKFTKCFICNLKFTEVAYKLHMNYHNYKKSSKKIVIKYENDDDVESKDIGSVSHSKECVSPPVKNMVKEKAVEKYSNLYSCVCCNILVDNYDKVIEHCQLHYGYKETQTNDQTNIIGNDEKLLPVKFDPFYFRFENHIWLKHVFEKLSTEEIEDRIKDSIYKFECRLLMEVIQPGQLNLTLYKCDVCRLYIDPSNMYSHIDTMCKVVKKYPCSQCGLHFFSPGYRIVHEKVHEHQDISKASYKIVLFNKREHQKFTKMMYKSRDNFILYQCRTCEGIVDKMQRDQHQCYHGAIFKCPYCGLLFYEQDYELHLVKHKTIHYLDNEHITVVMFGKLDVRKDESLRPSFNGTVYDLTFYKCKNCGLCLENKNEINGHICEEHLDKSICHKCRLYFMKKMLNSHLKLHEKRTELEYSDFCSNIVLFNTSTIEINDNESVEVEQLKQNENNNMEQNLKPNLYPKEILYKCKCGLHFLEKGNATRHTSTCHPKIKISRQSCFRCNLLFTPGELFNHLLKHHSNKNLKYQYDIISVI